MEQVRDVLEVVEAAVYVAVGLVAVRHWRRRGGAAPAWLAATFGLLSLLVVMGLFLPDDARTDADQWARRGAVALIVLFPYLLYRFARSFERRRDPLDVVAAALTAGLAVAAFFLRIPDSDESRSAPFQAYVIVLLVQWSGLCAVVCHRLWRAGRGQPTVARRRMRLMGLGALGMAVAILIAGSAQPSEEPTAATVLTQALALLAAPLFLLGFAPPPGLLAAWRRREEEALQKVIVEMMVATTRDEVVASLLPALARTVAARGATLVDAQGGVIGSYPGPRPDANAADREVRITLPGGVLVVTATPYTPYFGYEELDLLRTLGVLALAAIERCDLLERERRSVDELERTNRQLAEAQRVAHLGSWRRDLVTDRMSWSEELYRIYGLHPAGELSREALLEMIHPEDRDVVRHHTERLLVHGEPLEVEFRVMRPDGRVRVIHSRGSVVTDERGNPREVIGTAQDVTEQRHLDIIRREFIANAAHELRTPLTTVAGMAMLIKDHSTDLGQERLTTALEALGRQGERAKVLISNLLDLSQLDLGKSGFDLSEVRVRDAAQRVLEAAPPPAGATVEVRVPDDLTVLADPVRLEQVLTNLLANAYRYGGHGITMEAAARNGDVLVAVADDGAGVPDDVVDILFEPFTRARVAQGKQGSGLGLAICRRLVQAFDGDITYEPNRPHGARFVLRLRPAA